MFKKNKVGIIVGFLVASVAFSAYKVEDRLFEIAKNLDVFSAMYKELNAYYVDEINPTKAMKTSIVAMLKELDPYTVFYAEDDIEDYFTMNTGTYNGIGATVEFFEGKHTVVMLIEGSPADKAGIKIGDDILKINNVDVTDKNDAEFGRLLKGQTGSSVKVQVKRFGEKKTLDFSLARGVVKTSDVPHFGMINDEVGYVYLSEFSATAAKDIKSATLEMKDKGMKKLILDLRGNPGGLLNQAVEICNFFIPKGVVVVETKGKVKEWNKKYGTNANPLDTEMPVIVLINGKSASASEIVSGTLQDYDRGVLIGQRSFGKGLVQVTRDLSFNTKMKITTSKYYIPSGRCIQAVDYGHRGADGSVSKLPDSLRSVFKTKNGRLVLDGGGVDPDIKTKGAEMSDFTKFLISKKVLFDFATKYYFTHIDKKPEQNFSLSNADMNEFDAWYNAQPNKYKTGNQKAVEELEKVSKKEGEYEAMKGKIAELNKIADASASKLTVKYRSEIKEQLELEILSKFYYQKAMKFVSFEKDEEVQQALLLFKDMNKYKSILAGK
jgi:carboxyl-terminal processing protease